MGSAPLSGRLCRCYSGAFDITPIVGHVRKCAIFWETYEYATLGVRVVYTIVGRIWEPVTLFRQHVDVCQYKEHFSPTIVGKFWKYTLLPGRVLLYQSV